MVPRERVAEVWPHVLPHVEAALAQSAGEYWPQDVQDYCAQGDWQLWIATRPGELVGMATTEVMDYPRARLLFVHLAGAREGQAVTAMWPLVQTFAASQGCSALRLVGRRGWARSGFVAGPWRVTQENIVIPVEG